MKKTYKLCAMLAMLSAAPAIAQLQTPLASFPKQNATNVSVNTAIGWKHVPLATSYQLKLYNADSKLILDTLTNDTIFRPAILKSNTIYSWLIRAKSKNDSSAYVKSNFTTEKMSVPATPTVISPMGEISVMNSEGTSTKMAFNWSATTFATKYHLQVSNDYAFKDLLINDSTLIDNYYLNPKLLFTYTNGYFWRVAAKNELGKSDFTNSISFRITDPAKAPSPIMFLNGPPSGTVNVPTDYVSFVWKKNNSATSYSFMLGDNKGQVFFQKHEMNVNDTTVQLTGLPKGTLFTVYAYAYNQYGSSNPTTIQFTTENSTTVPAAPTRKSTESMGNALFYYYNTDAITKKIVAQWSDNKLFKPVLLTDSLSFPSSNFTTYSSQNLALNKWYYVKIVAKNQFGSSVALIDSVYNGLPRPNPVYIVSPRDSSITLTPIIKWTTSKWATSYKIFVIESGSKDTLYRSLSLGDTLFVLPAGYLKAGTNYTLSVSAENSYGSSTSISDFKTSKMISSLGVPITKKDTVFQSNGVPYPNLTWSAVKGATSYCVQISKDATFSQFIVNQCNVTGTSYELTPKILAFDGLKSTSSGKLYWRVAAANASGQGDWSSTSTFSVAVITATEENSFNQTVSVFPNPVINTLTINADVVSVDVKNANGAVVLQSATNTVDMSNLASGVYFVEFKTKAGATQMTKVLKGE